MKSKGRSTDRNVLETTGLYDRKLIIGPIHKIETIVKGLVLRDGYYPKTFHPKTNERIG